MEELSKDGCQLRGNAPDHIVPSLHLARGALEIAVEDSEIDLVDVELALQGL